MLAGKQAQVFNLVGGNEIGPECLGAVRQCQAVGVRGITLDLANGDVLEGAALQGIDGDDLILVPRQELLKLKNRRRLFDGISQNSGNARW